jgi:hypothetical protein
MAKENDNQQFQQRHLNQQQMPQNPPRQEQPRYVFRTSWLLVPISLFGMYYLLANIKPALKWNNIMVDILHVHNRQRYTSLGILCLIIIFIVAAAKITGKK